MFHKKSTSTESNPTRSIHDPPPRTQTVIAAGVRVEGDLKSPSGVELHGAVEGRFDVAGLLAVRESGRVIGDIAAQDVIVEGAVEGRVVATGRIELGSTGRIHGDIRAQAVSIADGAYFQGKVEMTAASESPERPQKIRLAAEAAV